MTLPVHHICCVKITYHGTTLTEVFLERNLWKPICLTNNLSNTQTNECLHLTYDETAPLRGCLPWDALLCIA